MNSFTFKKTSITINPDILKIIALIAMFIDHFAKYFPMNSFSVVEHYIGRISFPIFSVLLMYHLSQKQIYQKYIIRLSLFGFLTLILLFPFKNSFSFNTIFPLNIMFSFLVAVLALKNYEWVKKENASELTKQAFLVFNFCFFTFLSLFCQYNLCGFFLLIFLYFYFQKQNDFYLFLALLFSVFINPFEWKWIISIITTIILLLFVNYNKQAPRIIKPWWIIYVCYPLHLILFAIIKYLIDY